jgi:hypothetical protein
MGGRNAQDWVARSLVSVSVFESMLARAEFASTGTFNCDKWQSKKAGTPKVWRKAINPSVVSGQWFKLPRSARDGNN